MREGSDPCVPGELLDDDLPRHLPADGDALPRNQKTGPLHHHVRNKVCARKHSRFNHFRAGKDRMSEDKR